MAGEKCDINQWLIEFIKQRREELGLTQIQLAKRAGIGQPYVSKIESGIIRSPSSSTLKALAEALEIEMDELEDRRFVVPDDEAIGYCPNRQCPGSEAFGPGFNDWTPYATALEDEEGHIEFCIHCGTRLLTECQNCGRKMKRLYRYCPGCGHGLLVGENTEATNDEDDDVPF